MLNEITFMHKDTCLINNYTNECVPTYIFGKSIDIFIMIFEIFIDKIYKVMTYTLFLPIQVKINNR